jgi:hypothetical protein
MNHCSAIAERHAPVYSDRLDFELRNFLRLAWVSETARTSWGPRLSAIRRAMTRAEWMSVALGMRAAALVALSRGEQAALSREWESQGLASARLDGEMSRRMPYWTTDQSCPPGPRVLVAIAHTRALDDFLSAWMPGHHNAIAAMLGYPDCCSALLHEACIRESCVDSTWAMGRNSPGEEISTRAIRVRGIPATNILLSPLGIRAVPHRPCSFHCSDSAGIAEHWRNLIEDSQESDAEAYAWLRQILSWPAEWSALHGIAEVRSPVLKLCTSTDATAGKYVIQWLGDSYPNEGASGLVFPYRLGFGRSDRLSSEVEMPTV